MRSPFQTVAAKAEAEPESLPVRMWHESTGDVADVPLAEELEYRNRGYARVAPGQTDFAPRDPRIGQSPEHMLASRGVAARARVAAALGTTAPRKGGTVPLYITDLEDVAALAEQVRQLRADVDALRGVGRS